MRRLIAAALVVVWCGPAGAAPGQPPEVYTVRPGDSCWSIAERFYGSPRKYTLIHKHNKLGPLPHVLQEGQKIRLVGVDAGPDAVLEWLKRDVKAKPANSVDWLRAWQDMNLWRLYRVTTGAASAARIQFEDSSNLRLREQALLVIYGSTSSKARTDSVAADTQVKLEKGTLRGGLAALDAKHRLNVTTPAGAVSVAATDAQIEVDEAKTSAVSVYDGEADVTAKGAKVVVPADHGTYVELGKRPAKPRRLPPPPAWAEGGVARTVLAPEGLQGTFEARWAAVAKAKRYRVELAEDERFQRILVDATVGAGITRFRAERLDPGAYWARVAAIDDRRLEGRASAPLRVQVARVATSRLLAPDGEGVLSAVGLLRLVVPGAAAAGLEVAVDDGPFAAASVPVYLVTPGLHVVRTRAPGQAGESELTVRIIGVSGRLTGPDAASEPGQTVALALHTVDALGRPAQLPGLTLWASSGEARALVPAGPGRFDAELALAADAPSEVLVVARWAGGELARTSLAVNAPHAPPRPPAGSVTWPDPVATAPWRVRRSPGADLATGGVSHVGLSTAVVDDPEGADGAALRLTAGGELALLGGDLSLGLELPFFVVDLARDAPGSRELGDLRLGLRGLALAGPVAKLAAGLWLGAPSGGALGGVTDGTAEPFAALRVRLAEGLTADTRQSLLVASDFADATRVVYGGTYGLSWRPLAWLDVAAALDTRFGLSGPTDADAAVALALGGSVGARLARVRLGLFAAGALNADARAHLGGFSAGLSLQLGYPGP